MFSLKKTSYAFKPTQNDNICSFSTQKTKEEKQSMNTKIKKQRGSPNRNHRAYEIRLPPLQLNHRYYNF